MKLRLFLCVLLFISTAYANSEQVDLKESRKPTWIERLFGVKNSGDEPEVVEKSDASSEETKAEKDEAKSERAAKEKKFTDEERQVMEDWLKGNASWKQSDKPLPPRLRKKLERGGELPPGWKKKLAVGEVLEPELDAQSESLPEEILKRLPNSEAGTEILRVGDEIIRVLENSREIVDILNRRKAPDSVEN